MQIRLLSIAVLLLAGYLAFGSYIHASTTSTPENLISDLGNAIFGIVESVKVAIFG